MLSISSWFSHFWSIRHDSPCKTVVDVASKVFPWFWNFSCIIMFIPSNFCITILRNKILRFRNSLGNSQKFGTAKYFIWQHSRKNVPCFSCESFFLRKIFFSPKNSYYNIYTFLFVPSSLIFYPCILQKLLIIIYTRLISTFLINFLSLYLLNRPRKE